MSTRTPHVLLEHEGPLSWIVLARPDARNALTEDMGIAISQFVREIEERPDTRVVLVRGEGTAFSAGGDLGFLDARAASTPEENRRTMRAYYELFLSVMRLRVPSIAVIHGPAMGAGVCLALACDMRMAARGATMALNFVRLGLHPGMAATYTLPRLVGPSKAAELLLTGRRISADEALRIGLVGSVHELEELLAAARALGTEIAEAAPLAVAHTKRTLRGSLGRSLDDALELEAAAQAMEYGTEDLAEGVRAARARRTPRFQGR
jgi:enoyl-CoA hydratase/carnithine racemase